MLQWIEHKRVNNKINYMKFGKLLAIGVMAVTMTSCVSKKEFDALNQNYKQSIENLAERQREIQDLKSSNAGLSSENNLLRNQNDA